MRYDGTTLRDGEHDLIVYKVGLFMGAVSLMWLLPAFLGFLARAGRAPLCETAAGQQHVVTQMHMSDDQLLSCF